MEKVVSICQCSKATIDELNRSDFLNSLSARGRLFGSHELHHKARMMFWEQRGGTVQGGLVIKSVLNDTK
jgi:hypothetical protein